MATRTDSPTSAFPASDGEMAQRIRDCDWASTPLGPIESWPQSLRTAVEILLTSGFPTVALWGPELIQIYNDGYRLIMGDKHPAGLGQAARDCWPEVWHINEPLYRRVLAGETLTFEDMFYPLVRNGPLKDAWFSISCSPLRNDQGAIAGMLVTLLETTARVLAEHSLRASEERQAFLLGLADRLRQLPDAREIVAVASNAIGRHLGVSSVGFCEIEPDEETFTAGGQYGDGRMPSLAGWRARFSDLGPGFGPRIRAGEMVVSDDLGVTPVAHGGGSPEAAARSIAAGVGVPLIKHGRLVSFFYLMDPEPRLWLQTDLDLIRKVADRAWEAVERARAEAALRKREAQYRLLFESMDQGFCTIEVLFDDAGAPVDYIFLEMNPAFERHTGLRDAVGKRMRELAPEHEQHWFEIYGRIALTGVPERFEQEAAALGRWYSVYAFRVGTPEQRQVAVLFEDITARQHADTALRSSEARLSAIANLIPDLLWSNDPTGVTTWCNERMVQYTGRACDSSGFPWPEVIHPDDRAASLRAFQEALVAGAAFHREHRLRRHDGAWRWFLMSAEPVRDAEGRVERWFGTATDVHRERMAHDYLSGQVAAATAELRAVSRRLLVVQEEERRHLARELHDEIGQSLTALQLLLAMMGRAGGSARTEAMAIVREVTSRVSEISMDLRPAALDTLGLVPALLWHVDRFQARTGVRIDLRHSGLDHRVPATVETVAFRVVQEALTNIARHAGVKEATVRLIADDASLIVQVRDNGQGFDPGRTDSAGGLSGLRERVELLDGTVTVETAPGAGVTIIAELPLAGPAATPEHAP